MHNLVLEIRRDNSTRMSQERIVFLCLMIDTTIQKEKQRLKMWKHCAEEGISVSERSQLTFAKKEINSKALIKLRAY